MIGLNPHAFYPSNTHPMYTRTLSETTNAFLWRVCTYMYNNESIFGLFLQSFAQCFVFPRSLRIIHTCSHRLLALMLSPGLLETLRVPQSLGFLGGRPNHAIFFIGAQGATQLFSP